MANQIKAKDQLGGIVNIDLDEEKNVWKYEYSDKEFDNIKDVTKQYDLEIIPFEMIKDCDDYILSAMFTRFPVLCANVIVSPVMTLLNSTRWAHEGVVRFCLKHDDYFRQTI